ncbi:olfactory receptor 6N1-like [Myripristis murdjan]|uniref:olfactory receptor 6N1-like n=1 Tax=Myripristis murdjan TaxID=586833 RepID=UPI001175F32C|nr:olfactory receptor 6N1-like [Myripristis murdjan]
MGNSSEVVFLLGGLNETEASRCVFFFLGLLSYLFTVWVSLSLVVSVILEKMLHEPMYVFLCNLCLNGVYGASSFYPKLLHDLLADAHVISYAACMAQIFAVYSYVFCQFTNLTAMAYDRYVAICRPLQYRAVMTPQKVARLLLLTWSFSLLETAVGVALTCRLPICGVRIDRLFCSNWAVVRLSCADTTLNNVYGFVLMLSHVAQTALILVSYVHIVRAALRSAAGRRKFMQTCLPHLITLLNFTLSLVVDIMYARYGGGGGGGVLQNILAVEFLVVPPLINPVIYGMNLQQIRRRLARTFSRKVHLLT